MVERKEYTMKKLIALFLVILLLPSIAFAEVTPEQLDDLSEADRTILLFNVGVAIARKESGELTCGRTCTCIPACRPVRMRT